MDQRYIAGKLDKIIKSLDRQADALERLAEGGDRLTRDIVREELDHRADMEEQLSAMAESRAELEAMLAEDDRRAEEEAAQRQAARGD